MKIIITTLALATCIVGHSQSSTARDAVRAPHSAGCSLPQRVLLPGDKSSGKDVYNGATFDEWDRFARSICDDEAYCSKKSDSEHVQVFDPLFHKWTDLTCASIHKLSMHHEPTAPSPSSKPSEN